MANTFHQEKDTIYWLQITALLYETQSPAGAQWDWKTSLDHWNDDAVYWGSQTTVPSGSHQGWTDLPVYIELFDPQDQEVSLDMAFVITPEPATLALLLAAGLIVLTRRTR